MKLLKNKSLIAGLKEQVLVTAGITKMTASRCKPFADAIKKKTNHSISETTLKRVFNFAVQKNDLSLFTLNALAVFAGYDSWDHYVDNADATHFAERSTTQLKDSLDDRCRSLSLSYLQIVIKEQGVNLEQIVIDWETTSRLYHFLQSKHLMAFIVSPAQFGKTVNTCLWVKDHYDQTDHRGRGPLLLLLNASRLYTFLNSHVHLEKWLTDLLALPDAGELCRRETTVIIDTFDERSFSREKLKILHQRLYEFCLDKGVAHYIKVVLVIRPSLWNELAGAYRGREADLTAIPVNRIPGDELSANDLAEIILRLKKSGMQEKHIPLLDQAVIIALRYPFYLNEFCLGYHRDHRDLGKQAKWLMDAIHQHLGKSRSSSNQHKVRQQILDLLCEKLLEGNLATYEDLPKDEVHYRALYELIDHNIIREPACSNTFHDPFTLRFSDTGIAGYFVCQHLKKTGKSLPPYKAINDAAFSKWIWQWDLYFLFTFKKAIEAGVLDQLFFFSEFSGRQKLEGLHLLAQLHEPTPEFIQLLKGLNKRFRLLNLFFGQAHFLQYLSFSNIYFLKILTTVCEDDRMLHDLLSLIFLVHAYANNAQDLQELRITDRLPLMTDSMFLKRGVLMEFIAEMILYQVATPVMPEFLSGYLSNTVGHSSGSHDAAYLINLLLLQLYVDAGSVIQPQLFRYMRMLPVDSQTLQELPDAAKLIVCFILLLQPLAADELEIITHIVRSKKMIQTARQTSDIFQCIFFATNALLLQRTGSDPDDHPEIDKLQNIAARNGWEWFMSESAIPEADEFSSDDRERSTREEAV